MAASKKSQAQGALKKATATVSKPTTASADWIQEMIERGKTKLADAKISPAESPAPKSETAPTPSPVNWLDYRVSVPSSVAEPVSEPDTSARSARGYGLSAPTSAPTFSRSTSARIILLAGAVNAVAVAIRNSGKQPVKATVGSHTVTIPASLRSYAGTVILVTVALIVNEVSPDIGMLMAVGIAIMAFLNTDVMHMLGGALAPGTPSKTVPTGPSSNVSGGSPGPGPSPSQGGLGAGSGPGIGFGGGGGARLGR